MKEKGFFFLSSENWDHRDNVKKRPLLGWQRWQRNLPPPHLSYGVVGKGREKESGGIEVCHHFPSLGLGVKSGKCQIHWRDASFLSLRFWRRLLFRGFVSVCSAPIQIREPLGHGQEASGFNLDTKPLSVAYLCIPRATGLVLMPAVGRSRLPHSGRWDWLAMRLQGGPGRDSGLQPSTS